jgi:DNA modification methylase
MASLPAESVDAVVTDPPYGLEFMGRDWDRPWAVGFSQTGYTDAARRERPSFGSNRNPVCLTCHRHKRGAGGCECAEPRFDETPAHASRGFQVWCEVWAREALRVLKPGGHLLAFGGTRTYHRLTCAIEDAGFEIRDCLAWLYGSGFPKSLDVSKAIDKAAGAQREVVGDKLDRPGYHLNGHDGGEAFGHGLSSSTPETRLAAAQITAPATPEAQAWAGWGTALKPSHEPVVVARKPLRERTVAAQVLATGTGGLNIDACRIAHASDADRAESEGKNQHARYANPGSNRDSYSGQMPPRTTYDGAAGRWPANVALDGEAARLLDSEVGGLPGGTPRYAHGDKPLYGSKLANIAHDGFGDQGGGPSRFFYTAKASTGERDGATHPTVKPLDLMRWLVRLVTPPGGVVLEPFAGSGTTLLAAKAEGFGCIGIERDPAYAAMAAERYRRRWIPAEAEWKAADEDDQLSLLGGAE